MRGSSWSWTPTWKAEGGDMPTQAATPALTKMIVALSVVACHMGAAAPVPLADTALVQCVGGEEHPITANGLQKQGERLLRRCGWRRGATALTGRVASTVRMAILLVQCLTTSHFPDTQTPRRSVSLQEVPSRAGTMSCRWPSTVVQCRSHGLLEMWT